MGGILSTVIALKSGFFAIKGVVAIVGVVAALITGMVSCNKMIGGWKDQGRMEVERQVMASALENSKRHVAKQKQVNSQSMLLYSAFEAENRQIREQHAQEIAALEARLSRPHDVLSSPQEGEDQTCPATCIIP